MSQSRSPARRPKRLALQVLGSFVAAWLLAWSYRNELLEWLTEPLVRSLQGSQCSWVIRLYAPPHEGVLPPFLGLSTAAATFAALPFLAHSFLALTAPRALSSGRLTKIAFAVVSSAALAAVVYLVQRSLLPALVEDWLRDLDACSEKRLFTAAHGLRAYVKWTSAVFLGLGSIVQLLVVTLALWLQRRAATRPLEANP